MQIIRLERGEWSFDEGALLGPPGGFGEVFRGVGDGVPVAVKRLKLTAGAASHRELSIGSSLAERSHDHVVPILDYGQDAESDRYYLVMPVCDRSLQDMLTKAGPMNLDELKSVALDVIAGLIEVKDIVHRDLKPGNILWHKDRWKIADFGIAKFVEDATSLESLRSSLTPPYAAPEQWRGDRPTNATDVYALGCILYALLTGKPTFLGDVDDVREAHLHKSAPPIPGIDPRAGGLIASMLRKSPATRPSLERCALVLRSLEASAVSAGRAALAAAAHAVSQEEAAAEAKKHAEESAARERKELEEEGNQEIARIMNRLFDVIEESAESTRREKQAIVLGPAHLAFEFGSRTTYGRTLLGAANSYNHGWDVAANGYLTLRCDLGGASSYRPAVYNFRVSVVFARTGEDPDFRWRELSFMEVFSDKPMHEQPIALNPFEGDFAVAMSNVMGRHQIAYGPFVIDGEDEIAFQERWLRLFAKAAHRQLLPPSQLPITPGFLS